MKAKWYLADIKRVFIKSVFFVLLLLLSSIIPAEVYAQNNQVNTNENSLDIETKHIDYDNRLLYANIDIHLYIEANERSQYLILPVNKRPGISFFTEPNDDRTVLFGFLGDTGYCVIEVMPHSFDGELILNVNNVQFSLNESPDDKTFGCYDLCFGKCKENYLLFQSIISQNDIIDIGKIHIKDESFSYSKPESINKDNNTYQLTSNDMDTTVYIKKMVVKSHGTMTFGIVAAMLFFIIVDFVGITLHETVINWAKKYKIFQVILLIFSIVAFIGDSCFMVLYLVPNGFFEDYTVLCTSLTGSMAVLVLLGIAFYTFISKK